MRIADLIVSNFMAYRGLHTLKLGAKVYAITARLDADPERSNFLGKSSLLEAIFFCLYGEHRFRTEDEFISEGEASAAVSLNFSDGSSMTRSRERGKPTKLEFTPAGGAKAKGAEAQLLAEKALGLDKEDFRATSYWEQKQMSRFVTGKPEERTKMVSAWFKLEPLERCSARANALARSFEDVEKKGTGHLEGLAQRAKDLAKEVLGERPPEEKEDPEILVRTWIAGKVPEIDRGLGELAGLVARLESDLQANAGLLHQKSQVEEYRGIVDEGKKVKADLESRNPEAIAKEHEKAEALAREAAVHAGEARRALNAKVVVARGEFDGKCPVATLDCPVKARINEGRREAEAAAKVAEAASEQASAALRKAELEASSKRAAAQELQRISARLDSLRERGKKLLPVVKAAREGVEAADPVEIRRRLDQARGDLVDARVLRERLIGYVRELDAAAKTRISVEATLEKVRSDLGTAREAAVVFGKRGAQRKVAEAALARIEKDANGVLAEVGADLAVAVRWSREGQGIATACDACGQPFPASAKVKHCERCGLARGPKLENKLDVVLSRRSGAAEDMAGAAVQLSASRWLRKRRSAAWAVALLDEPFGALDAAHRKGLSKMVAGMLGGSMGIEQAFVVSHSPDATEACAGRIEIVSDGKWAKVRVAA